MAPINGILDRNYPSGASFGKTREIRTLENQVAASKITPTMNVSATRQGRGQQKSA
jgi:hypothetical protein